MPTVRFHDCEAVWDGETLAIRNARIERRWAIRNGLCHNASLRDPATGDELLTAPSEQPSPCPEFPVHADCRRTAVTAEPWQPVVVETPSLQVVVAAEYGAYRLRTVFKIYPGTPAISSSIAIEGDGDGREPAGEGETLPVPTGVEAWRPAPVTERAVDRHELFHLRRAHTLLGAVTLMDQTDTHDNLVQVRRDLLTIPVPLTYQGNLFYLEDQPTGSGLIFLKEAPLPHARPVRAEHDLMIRGDAFSFVGLGAGDAPQRESYPLTTLVYRGGRAGRIAALQEYQRCFRQFDAERDLLVWHAIWGDRNRDRHMGEGFLLRELDHLQALGLDFVYFSDGWQKGASSNSVVPGGRWNNQWEEPDYWRPHPQRFPRGLEAVTDRARARGMKYGMWFNPDKTDDGANWERDAEVVLDYHRRLGVRYFKFDGTGFTTKRGEANTLRTMHRVVQETGGRASVEIDVTGDLRTGYFGAMSYGVLFLENRYTDLHKYWPHCTLRNLWQLGEFVDPRRLRIEFLNNERNQELYGEDPLAPGRYPADYLFAITMFANPLAWFEAVNLSDTYRAALLRITSVYRQYRERIMRGTILPIGAEPTGFSWTGFQSQVAGEREGFVVCFRELHDEPAMDFTLAMVDPGEYEFTPLAGRGERFATTIGDSGTVRFALPDRLSYALYRYWRAA